VDGAVDDDDRSSPVRPAPVACTSGDSGSRIQAMYELSGNAHRAKVRDLREYDFAFMGFIPNA
jgi:hypothetical protein